MAEPSLRLHPHFNTLNAPPCRDPYPAAKRLVRVGFRVVNQLGFIICHLEREQSFCDVIDSFARPATCGNDLDVRLQGVNVVCQRFDAHAHSICQVDLVDDHDLCAEEHAQSGSTSSAV